MIGIMQPTFLPWLGYFGMMDRCKCFVFLDNVQYARGSWQQRNKIKSGGGELLVTVPVFSKGKRDQLIYEVEINEGANFLKKFKTTLVTNYSKAPYFKEYSPALFGVMERNLTKLSDLNIELIKQLSEILGMKVQFKKASDLSSKGHKAELLANICVELGFDTYISALGSKEYIEESTAFADKNVKIIYNDYNHPTYRQLYGGFVPYLSVVDLIFNYGPESLAIIRSGYNRDQI